MKHQDFWAGMASLCMAVGALGVYQAHAFAWQEQKMQQESGAAGTVSYADGTYTGSGDGFGGTITVEVTVADHQLTAIEISLTQRMRIQLIWIKPDRSLTT